MKTIIYLHGFRSSAQSMKGRLLGEALMTVPSPWEYVTPSLSHDPDLALAEITRLMASRALDETTLVGSSLGGYYALVMAARTGVKAVLLNPSLRPDVTLASWTGTHTNMFTHEPFEWTAAHIATLKAAAPSPFPAAEKLLLIVEMGDELLDHHATRAALPGVATIAVEGGDHDLKSFPAHTQAVLRFAGIAPLADADAEAQTRADAGTK